MPLTPSIALGGMPLTPSAALGGIPLTPSWADSTAELSHGSKPPRSNENQSARTNGIVHLLRGAFQSRRGRKDTLVGYLSIQDLGSHTGQPARHRRPLSASGVPARSGDANRI